MAKHKRSNKSQYTDPQRARGGNLKGNRTIAYLRISTVKQDLENQTHEIERYCEAHGLKVDDWKKVTMSSRKTPKERRIEKLLADLRKGDMLIVSELSRLGRSLSEVVLLVEQLIKKKIRLIAIKQNLKINGSPDPVTKAMIGLFSIFGEMERDMISLRTKNGLAAAKARGVKLGNPKLKADNEKSKRKAQEWAENLRPILEGLIEKGHSQRVMVQELINARVPTRRGGKWSLVQLQNTLKRLGLKTQRAKG
jgi:DNA invertase Pin-like site-specific DNA recombinase